MRNLQANLDKFLEHIKPFAHKMVNSKGNIPRRGIISQFSDLEVITLSITADTLSIDSVNFLF